MAYFGIFGSLLTFILLGMLQARIRYTQPSTVDTGTNTTETRTWAYADGNSKDSLYMLETQDNMPLYYYKKIVTSVCFDEKCRILNVAVFWNITGRYLGFELSAGEFLSKSDHNPFTASEYERLNDLLADPNLALGNIPFEELMTKPEASADNDLVDGISGATSTSVSNMVVKGAAYTTYTLWNIVYGSTQDYVSALTEKKLTPELIMLILQSPDITDRVWALERIPASELNPKVAEVLLEIISGKDFFLAYSAMNALSETHLFSNVLQAALFSKYLEVDQSIEKMMTDKLMKVPQLSPEVVTRSRTLLAQLNGRQLSDILRLYSRHSIKDIETMEAVARIINHKNQFISRQAYQFLKELNISEEEIDRLKNKQKG